MDAAKEAAKTRVRSLTDDNPVVVFSKSYCPYCYQTKRTLNDMGVKYLTLELDEIDDGAAIQKALGEMTEQSTVPNIFIDGKSIGGNDRLQELKRKGDLNGLLQQAGAL